MRDTQDNSCARAIRRQGFTLIELLVVLVLMAVLSAAAISTLQFSFGEEDVETEARRIGALVSLAAEEALLTGREIGMEIDGREIRFWYFDDIQQRWLPLGQEDGPFRDRRLPEAIDTDLILEGRPITLAAAESNDEEEDDDSTAGDTANAVDLGDQPEPQVLMFSSGQVTPFTMFLEDAELGTEWRIEVDLLGRVDVEAVE